MRLPLLIGLSALACLASADRLINAPTGRKIPYGTIRFEAMSELSSGRSQEYYLGAGIGTSFDLDLHSQMLDGGDASQTFDLGYNFIAPVPGFSPGLSIGVQDALDKTVDRRRPYVAVTFRPMFTTINGDYAADLTLGSYLWCRESLFVGGTLPFSREFRLLFEHNGVRLATGFELRPAPEIGFRMLFRERDVLASLILTRRF